MKFGIWINAAGASERIAVAIKASEIGFEGVGLTESAGDSAAEIAAIAPVACVASEGGFAEQSLERALALAKSAGAPLVRVKVGKPGRRPTAGALNDIANSLIIAGDVAAAMGIRLAVANSPELPLVRDLWTVVDRCQHPAVRCCWDASLAAREGQGPSTGVPVLNSYIAAVEVRVGAGAAGFEQGDRAVEELIHRLRGIGFAGYLLVGGVSGLDSMAPLAELLGKLRTWNAPPAATKHKAAAHVAPTKAAVGAKVDAGATAVERKKTPASPAGA